MTNDCYKNCYRIVWNGNKIVLIELTSQGSDIFTNTVLANHIGRLFVYSETAGDCVTTNGRSAINKTGAKSIITKGAWSVSDGTQYGGHVIISTEGKGSWLDNDANDDYGLHETPSIFQTPCGHVVYVYKMEGSWSFAGYPPTLVKLVNGDQYSINDACAFLGDSYTMKLILSIADAVLFETYNINLQNINIRSNAECLKNFYPASRPTSANITLGNGALQYLLATGSMTAGKPPEDASIIHMSADIGGYDKQLAVGYNGVYFRGQSGGTWKDWDSLWSSRGSNQLDANGGRIVISSKSYNGMSVSTTTGIMFSSANNNVNTQLGLHIGNGYFNTLIESSDYLYLKSNKFISSNTSIAIGSDEKVKTFTDDISGDEDKLVKLFDIINPKSYNYKYLSTDKLNIGFSAQEVEKSLKELDIDPEKYSILDIQYNYMLPRGTGEEDYKYYTKYMSISYTDLHNLAMLKIKDMEEQHTARLSVLEGKIEQLLKSSNGGE